MVGANWSVVGGMVGGRWIYTTPFNHGEAKENINCVFKKYIEKEPSNLLAQ